MTQALTLPREQLLPAWRAAVLAYRAVRQGGHDHHAAHAEAVAALRRVLPELSERAAVQEAILAVAYASREHTAWFWSGVGRR